MGAAVVVPDLYVVVRWPDGSLYAGPFASAAAFGPNLLTAAAIFHGPRAFALRCVAFGQVVPVVPGLPGYPVPGTEGIRP